MGKEFDMFDDFFKEEDFQIDGEEKEEEFEELELETTDPADYPDDPISVPGPTPDADAKIPDITDPDIGGVPDDDCNCDDDDGCNNCTNDPLDCADADCDCDHCQLPLADDGWDTGQKTKWDAGGKEDRKDPPPKSVWKQKTWKT